MGPWGSGGTRHSQPGKWWDGVADPHIHPPWLVKELQEATRLAVGSAEPRPHLQVAWCELLGVCTIFLPKEPLILRGTLTELRNLVTVRPTRQKRKRVLPAAGRVHREHHAGSTTPRPPDDRSVAMCLVPVPALTAETELTPQPTTQPSPTSLCLGPWTRSDQQRSRGRPPTPTRGWAAGERDGARTNL